MHWSYVFLALTHWYDVTRKMENKQVVCSNVFFLRYIFFPNIFNSLWPSDSIWLNIGSCNDLLPDGTKPLHEPVSFDEYLMRSRGIHLMANSQEIPKMSFVGQFYRLFLTLTVDKNRVSLYRWLTVVSSARLQYLQWISNGDTAVHVLH